jgi:hypothetical protein
MGRSPLRFTFPEGSDLFSLFQISLENYFNLKFRLWKEHSVDPSWVETIPFYEYQIWVDMLNKYVDKENKKALEESGQSEVFNFTNPNS